MSVEPTRRQSQGAQGPRHGAARVVGREVAVAEEKEVAAGPVRASDHARVMFEREHDSSRVLAITDGVFAIIMTLLVLDVHVPELSQGQSLNEALREVRASLTAFAISFILAGMYWVGHRDLFALIRRTDRNLVWLNILYLLPLCLLPFGTKLLGRYDQEARALRVYGLVLVAIAIMRAVIWLYATNRPHLLWQRLDDRQRRAGLAIAVVPGLIYLLAILIAEAVPAVALAIYAGIPLLYFLSITVLRRTRKGEQEYGEFT
jgi:TMEM175 potassium channel family protein